MRRGPFFTSGRIVRGSPGRGTGHRSGHSSGWPFAFRRPALSCAAAPWTGGRRTQSPSSRSGPYPGPGSSLRSRGPCLHQPPQAVVAGLLSRTRPRGGFCLPVVRANYSSSHGRRRSRPSHRHRRVAARALRTGEGRRPRCAGTVARTDAGRTRSDRAAAVALVVRADRAANTVRKLRRCSTARGSDRRPSAAKRLLLGESAMTAISS